MINLLLADDQAMVRDALAALLDLEPDFTVVAAVGTGAEAVAQVRSRDDIHVALLDVEMPDMDGLSAAAAIHELRPDTKICMVTTFGKPGYVRRAFEAGATGFIVKDTPAAQLATQIRAITTGARIVDPQLALESLTAGINPLTTREMEVLAEVARGGSVDDVANAVCLSPGTVRNHISAILAKTGARNRAEAAQIARRNGWLTGI